MTGYVTGWDWTQTHGDEEDAAQQGAGERRLDELVEAPGACTVALQQRRDIEGDLRDGAEGGVHHCTHRKVTLCRDAAGKVCNIICFSHNHPSTWR